MEEQQATAEDQAKAAAAAQAALANPENTQALADNPDLGSELEGDEDDMAGAPEEEEEQEANEVPASPKPKVKKAEKKVNYKLEQEDDEPRDPAHPPLTLAAIKELNKTGQDWTEHFDPLSGMAPGIDETAKGSVPVKAFQVVPDMEGSGKSKTQKVVNGKPVYKPVKTLRNSVVSYNPKTLTDVLKNIAGDLLSKYALENYSKQFNTSVHNEHYGRKMPLRAFNNGPKLSLECMVEASGESVEDFISNLFGAGWKVKSAAQAAFDLSDMCETSEEIEAVKAYCGKTIEEWKPTLFPAHAGTTALFKKIGKIVKNDFKMTRKPSSGEFKTVIECIDYANRDYEEFFNLVDKREKRIAAGELDASVVTDGHRAKKEACMIHIGRWNIIKCGLQALADQRLAEETKLMLKTQKANAVEMGEDFDPRLDASLDFMDI